MEEEQAQAVTEEFALPHPDQNQAQAPPLQEAPPKPPEEDPAERNWREARRKMEAMESEIERLRIERQQVQPPPEEEYHFDGENWVTGKDLQNFTEKHLAKEIDRRVQQQLQQREYQEAPNRLRSSFSDFDQVVNEDALQQLKMESPHLFETIMSSNADPYKRGAAVYSILKSQSHPTADNNRARMEQNATRPRSLDAAHPGSPVAEIGSNYGVMTEERKAQVYKQMRARQGYA